MSGGIEIAGDWRRQQGVFALVSGQVAVDEVRRHGWAKAVIQAAKTRTTNEALDQWEGHLNELQNELLRLAIVERKIEVELMA